MGYFYILLTVIQPVRLFHSKHYSFVQLASQLLVKLVSKGLYSGKLPCILGNVG